uniref:Phostensin n=1 Tax=Gouania willdenowi TaxID=441366 RepID=A0A8C5GD47_GOUWI
MSVTLLPEWKQLLLERKRREEEERGRREKEEEEKFANMPAWKRGIIQRRKAKQDVFESKVANQVSLETIVPVHENPFIRTQCVWRKGRDGEGGNELEVKEREKWTPRIQDGDMDRGHDVEQKLDREEEATAASEVTSDCFQIVQEEDYSLKKVEEELRCLPDRQENKEAKKELDVTELEGYESPLDLEQTFLPSPPNPDSLTAMSRIYNLDMVATDCAPTPASSPCSPSPSQSPNISPSPSPSPTLFSIRSASGGPVKRGATITITPKKTVLGAAMGHTVRPMAAELTSTNTKSLQNHISTTAAEESKKKYPTVEEIEVIGGYENLERSCLIKKGGTPKRVSKDNKPEKTFFIQCYSLGTKNTQK